MLLYELEDGIEDAVWACAAPPRELLQRRSIDVAPALLGMLVAKGGVGLIITEVEAYGGRDDAASHAYRGISSRNCSMFEDGGTLYVYLSYGIHRCVNIVTGTSGDGEAVLIRSGIAVEAQMDGRDSMHQHGTHVSGPGRVGRVLDAQLGDDGTDLLLTGRWKLLDASALTVPQGAGVARSRRIGISKATELEWRFELRPC